MPGGERMEEISAWVLLGVRRMVVGAAEGARRRGRGGSGTWVCRPVVGGMVGEGAGTGVRRRAVCDREVRAAAAAVVEVGWGGG